MPVAPVAVPASSAGDDVIPPLPDDTPPALPAMMTLASGLVINTPRKRKTLSFSELTDVVVEEKISTVNQFWVCAKHIKLNGDPTLLCL